MKKLLLLLLCVPSLGFSQKKDFVSELDLGNIYNNKISIDFVVLGIFGNELYEHYENCRLKELSLYSYDTIWNIHHLGGDPDNQEDPRIAFLNNDNFHLMDFEIWDPIKKDFIIGPYKPNISGYDFYLGNGFAFSDMNELLDFNEDGYLDRKIKYSKLDYEESRFLTNEILNEMFSEYEEKIENGEISKDRDWEEYREKEFKLNNNFGWWGYGYLTKYSDDGYLYFLQ